MPYFICEKCNSHYKLQRGEFLEGFNTCRCGGKLKYSESPMKDSKMFEDSVANHIKHIAQIALSKKLNRKQSHDFMQNRIFALAEEFDLKGLKEFRVKYEFNSTRKGLIDVVWLENDKPFALFEIDSAVRTKSIHKLLAIGAPFKFWIYYGQKEHKLKNALLEHDLGNLINVIWLPKIYFRA